MDNFDLRKYLAENKLTQDELNEENLEEGWKEWALGGLMSLATLAGIGQAYVPNFDSLSSDEEIELAQNAYGDALNRMAFKADVDNFNDSEIAKLYNQVAQSDIKGDLKPKEEHYYYAKDGESAEKVNQLATTALAQEYADALTQAASKNMDRFVISKDGTVTFVTNPGGITAIKEEEKPSTKMKKSELKEMIKAAFIAEMDMTNAQDDDAALAGMYDPTVDEAEDMYEEEDLDEMLARLSEEEASLNEQDEEEEEDVDVEVDVKDTDLSADDEEVESANDSIVVDKKIVSLSSLPSETRKILDTLETLRAQAEEFGDQKFITQVGNTITFFTRDFVVAGDAPNPAGIEESAFPMWNKIK